MTALSFNMQVLNERQTNRKVGTQSLRSKGMVLRRSFSQYYRGTYDSGDVSGISSCDVMV